MFKPLFDMMNEALDELIRHYPAATGAQKQMMSEQLDVLRGMSDTCIEEWLSFEEKMSKIKTMQGAFEFDEYAVSAVMNEWMSRGLGYFKLFMFPEAISQFEQVLEKYPEALEARLYLALSYLQNQDFHEAYQHFRFLLPLAEDDKIKAVSYNAMGCIQAANENLEKACELFRLAHEADPSLEDPIINMAVCKNEDEGALQYGVEFLQKE